MYTFSFVPSKAGGYTIEGLVNGLSGLKFKGSNHAFGTLQVHSDRQRLPTCGTLSVQQDPGAGTENSLLKINVKTDASVPNPRITFLRADASEEIPGTMANGTWSTSPKEMKTGSWKLEYRSGNEVCETRNLTKVTCKDAFTEKRGECNAVQKASGLQKVLGACIGVVLVVVSGYFAYIASKNPK